MIPTDRYKTTASISVCPNIKQCPTMVLRLQSPKLVNKSPQKYLEISHFRDPTSCFSPLRSRKQWGSHSPKAKGSWRASVRLAPKEQTSRLTPPHINCFLVIPDGPTYFHFSFEHQPLMPSILWSSTNEPCLKVGHPRIFKDKANTVHYMCHVQT